MIPQRPYLFDAIYRWILDNGFTPYVLVDGSNVLAQVPQHLLTEENQIVLNIRPDAIAYYVQDEKGLRFSARFSGKSYDICIPFSAMLALYARENGQGIIFPNEEFVGEDIAYEGDKKTDNKKNNQMLHKQNEGRPELKIIK